MVEMDRSRRNSWLSEKQVEEYYEVFISFDSDGDKALTVAELAELMKYIGEYNENFNGLEILKDIDANDNGLVEFEEFLFLLQLSSGDRNQMVNAAFKVLDPTGDGVITTESLQRAVSNLGVKISEEEIKSMVKEADPEGKGTIDFQELKTMIQESDDSVSALQKGHKRLVSIAEESENSDDDDDDDSRDPSERSTGSKTKGRRRKRKSKAKNKRRRRRRNNLYRMLWIFTLNAVVRKIHGNMDMYRGKGGNKQKSMFPAIPQKHIITQQTSLKPMRRPAPGNSNRSLMSTPMTLTSSNKPYVSYTSKRAPTDSPRYSMYYLNPERQYVSAESVAWFNAPLRTHSDTSYYRMRRKNTL